MKGMPLTQEHKEKISKSHMGLPSPMKGRKLTQQHKDNIGKSNQGKIRSEESLENQSKSHIGLIQSIETRNKRSKTLTGMKHPHVGHPVSDKTKSQLCEFNTGKTHLKSTRKKISEFQKISGKWKKEKNPNWQGGTTSYEPYCIRFNYEFKERVRAFFMYHCVECGKPQTLERLHVHHVDFNKKTCCDDTIPLFVCLCRSCHTKTNRNRPYWIQHFKEIIQEQFGGKCYYSKIEMTSLGGSPIKMEECC